MICFADSSAVVKLYAGEEGADAVRDLSGIAVAQIARVEVPAALWRKHRLAELTAEEAGVLTAELEADYFGTDEEPPRFVAVATTAGLLDEAARLCGAHGLRAYDAVQLASALLARALDDSCATIAAFDSSLRGAAAAEGFALLPAEV